MRLAAHHRQWVRDAWYRTARPAKEEQMYVLASRKIFPALRDALRPSCPDEDMAILAKYGVGRTFAIGDTMKIHFSVPDDGTSRPMATHVLVPEVFTLPVGHVTFQFGSITQELMDALVDLHSIYEAWDAARDALRSDFERALMNVKTLKDLMQLWPGALDHTPQLAREVPGRVSTFDHSNVTTAPRAAMVEK